MKPWYVHEAQLILSGAAQKKNDGVYNIYKVGNCTFKILNTATPEFLKLVRIHLAKDYVSCPLKYPWGQIKAKQKGGFF